MTGRCGVWGGHVVAKNKSTREKGGELNHTTWTLHEADMEVTAKWPKWGENRG